MTYTTLDKLGDIVEKTDRTKLQTLRVNIVGVIVDAGEVKAPRVAGRGEYRSAGAFVVTLPLRWRVDDLKLTETSSLADWYRSFLITDPTRLDSSIEVQWYAKGEGGLPEPHVGEVFVARQLAVRPFPLRLA